MVLIYVNLYSIMCDLLYVSIIRLDLKPFIDILFFTSFGISFHIRGHIGGYTMAVYVMALINTEVISETPLYLVHVPDIPFNC